MACMGEMKNKSFGRKTFSEETTWKAFCAWEDDIKIDIDEKGWQSMD
jgi:hypothetical protein